MTVNIYLFFFNLQILVVIVIGLFFNIFVVAGQKIYNVGVLSVDFINVVIARTI